MGNFTLLGLRLALAMLASLFVGMTVREYGRARATAALGDPTPRLWGRITLRPKPWFDPFGSGFVPALIALLWAVGSPMIPAAYAKPAPIDPTYLRRYPRDVILASLAGPAASLAVAIVGGLAVRTTSLQGEALLYAVTFVFTNASLFVFHLLPIPGLDGGRLVAMLLPPQAREVFRNADRYLPLIVLVLLFVLFSILLGLVSTLTGAICDAATGTNCLRIIAFF
jgi:Zn-dependent protease